MVTDSVQGNWISTEMQNWLYHPGVNVLLVRFYPIFPLSYPVLSLQILNQVTDFGSDFVYKRYI